MLIFFVLCRCLCASFYHCAEWSAAFVYFCVFQEFAFLVLFCRYLSLFIFLWSFVCVLCRLFLFVWVWFCLIKIVLMSVTHMCILLMHTNMYICTISTDKEVKEQTWSNTNSKWFKFWEGMNNWQQNLNFISNFNNCWTNEKLRIVALICICQHWNWSFYYNSSIKLSSHTNETNNPRKTLFSKIKDCHVFVCACMFGARIIIFIVSFLCNNLLFVVCVVMWFVAC